VTPKDMVRLCPDSSFFFIKNLFWKKNKRYWIASKIWIFFLHGYLTADTLSEPPTFIIAAGLTFEVQEIVRHGSCPTKPNLTTHEFVGELLCRTNSVSDKFRLPVCLVVPSS